MYCCSIKYEMLVNIRKGEIFINNRPKTSNHT